MLLYEVVDALDKYKVKHAIIGGYAMALHGHVRATLDVDLVLSLRQADFQSAEIALKEINLQSRLPVRAQEVFQMREEYIANRNLKAWSFVDYANPSRQVDILITKDLRDLTVQKIAVAGRKISVISIKDLIALKTEAGRPQDLVDIDKLKMRNS
jgi:hypothetical protein